MSVSIELLRGLLDWVSEVGDATNTDSHQLLRRLNQEIDEAEKDAAETERAVAERLDRP